MSDVIRLRLISTILLLVGVLFCGSLGYVFLEGWDFADGFFMTVITLSTVGYGETHELSKVGRWFTSILIVLCFISMSSWTAALTSFLVDADLSGNLAQRRMWKMISKLRKHTIVCGTSPMAEVVIEKLMRQQKDVVVIDEDTARLEQLRRRFRQMKTVEGTPTDELILAKGNLLEAANVVAALPSEVDNLLISITCKDLRQGITVYARSNDATIANRMRKAGVEEVICPSELCGARISGLILN